jgi:hypothetical protein
MTIKSRNTEPIPSSFVYSEDGLEFKYQANTEIFVEGNIYPNLFTPETIMNLVCKVDNMVNLQKVTEEQVAAFIEAKYPPIENL